MSEAKLKRICHLLEHLEAEIHECRLVHQRVKGLTLEGGRVDESRN